MRLSLLTFATAAIAGLASNAFSATQSGANLGDTYSEVRAAYPGAKIERASREGPPNLVLPAFTSYGVAWNSARLVFNRAGRLDHVTFTVKGGDYDSIADRVDVALQKDPALSGGLALASYVPQPPVEFRICEMSDSTIEVTLETTHLEI